MSAPGIDHPHGSLLDRAPLRIGAVTLVVRDLDRMARFYEDVIGLAVLGQDRGTVRLGVGTTVLLTLRHEPAARPWVRREAGLFHTAFLLPDRVALGAWLRHMAERRVPITGASDHIVSEAVYLDDPEGNGIEVYADRPSSVWRHSDGLVEMRTDPLDLGALMAAADRPWSGLPAGSRVGHVHLQTGDLERAQSFYGDLLGFTVMARYPGALFWGSGGYHHQLATNLWNSRGAPRRSELTTGLAEVELVAADPGIVAAVASRLSEGGSRGTPASDRLDVADPWGTTLRLVSASAGLS